MLLRMEALEKRIEDKAERGKQKAETDQTAAEEDGAAVPRNENETADRFSSRSLANSKIKRDGLKAATRARISPAATGRWRTGPVGLARKIRLVGLFQPALRPLQHPGAETGKISPQISRTGTGDDQPGRARREPHQSEGA